MDIAWRDANDDSIKTAEMLVRLDGHVVDRLVRKERLMRVV